MLKKGIFLAIAIIIGVFVLVFSKEIYKKKAIDQEIENLKQEAEKIQRENMKMEERIAYLGSKDYQEIQAKDKLNMQSPEEKLIVVSPGLASKKEAEPEEILPPILNESIPNYKKWWNYFIKN